MFRVEIESSNDPILDVLQSDPKLVFGRDFGGYFVFLFGAFDEEIATWLSRNLVSLDSLTGEDIACAVFARKVKIKSKHISSPGRYLSRFHKPMKENEEGILLESIDKRLPSDRFVKDGFSKWKDTEHEITAITYAADELAKRLNVLSQLPCLIIFDAIPVSLSSPLILEDINKLVIPFDKYSGKEVLKLMRNSIHELRQQSGYNHYLTALNEYQNINRKLDQYDKQFEDSEIRYLYQITNLENKKQIIINDFEALKWSLVNGSPKFFQQELNKIKSVNIRTKEVLIEKSKTDFALMRSYNSTIRSLEKYTTTEEKFELNIGQVCSIFKKYAIPLINGELKIENNVNLQFVREYIDILKQKQLTILNSYLLEVPNMDNLVIEFNDKIEDLLNSHEIDNEEFREKHNFLIKRLNDLSNKFININHPSLIEATNKFVSSKMNARIIEQDKLFFKWDFFIAYASPDKVLAEHVHSKLSEFSKVFLASKTLMYGDDWDLEISKAQQESRISIIIVSSDVDYAYYLREEIAIAIDLARRNQDQRVIPIYVNIKNIPAKFPYGLRLKHGVFLENISDFESVKMELVDLLGKITNTNNVDTK